MFIIKITGMRLRADHGLSSVCHVASAGYVPDTWWVLEDGDLPCQLGLLILSLAILTINNWYSYGESNPAYQDENLVS